MLTKPSQWLLKASKVSLLQNIRGKSRILNPNIPSLLLCFSDYHKFSFAWNFPIFPTQQFPSLNLINHLSAMEGLILHFSEKWFWIAREISFQSSWAQLLVITMVEFRHTFRTSLSFLIHWIPKAFTLKAADSLNPLCKLSSLGEIPEPPLHGFVNSSTFLCWLFEASTSLLAFPYWGFSCSVLQTAACS